MGLWEAFYGERIRLGAQLLAVAAITAALAVSDLGVGRPNFAIGYLLTVVAVAMLGRPRWLYAAVALTVGLTYTTFLLRHPIAARRWVAPPRDWRFVNRTLSVGALLGVAIAFARWHHSSIKQGDEAVARRLPKRNSQGPLGRRGPLVPRLFGNYRVAWWCVAASGMIAVADIVAPAQLNLAILYCFVLATCVWARSRTFLACLLLASVVLTRVGYMIGPISPALVLVPSTSGLLANRLLVRLCLIAVALLINPWLPRREFEAIDNSTRLAGADESGKLALSALEDASCGAAGKRLRRILYVDHTSTLGGAEIALLNLLGQLDRVRYCPIVVVSSDGLLVGRLRGEGIETHVLPLTPRVVHARKDNLGVRTLLRLGDIARTFRYVNRLARFMRANRIDLVHTNSLKADVIGGLAGRMAGRRVLWHVRDRINADYLPAVIVHVFRAACCVLADFVVTNSSATLGLLRPAYCRPSGNDAGQQRMRVVHDGVVCNAASLRADNRSLDGHSAIVGLVGRITPFKGQDVFIHAANLVHRQFPHVRFRVVGSPMFGEEAYEREVRQLATDLGLKDVVEFTGFRADIDQVMGELDIVVHASVFGEPFGQVIAEGMAAGKPVVATDGGGVPEIIENGVTGLLVPMRDPGAMATAICQLLADRPRAREMGRRAREHVRRHFSIDHTTAKMESLYRHIFDGQLRTVRRRRPRSEAHFSAVVQRLAWGGAVAELAYAVTEFGRSVGGVSSS